MSNGLRSIGRAMVVSALIAVIFATAGAAETHPTAAPSVVDAREEPVGLLSAFFGLDNGLPFLMNLLCLGGSGEDGMPVVTSHTLDDDTLEPEDFRVRTRSGAEHTPRCAMLAPAIDAGERRTVLLVGEFGDAGEDPPASVRVVSDLMSDGATGGRVNFRGTAVDVTPLAAGPSLVLAEVVPAHERSARTRGSSCPEGTRQVIRATWSGGVRRPNGDDAGDAERRLYRVAIERADGTREEIAPAALAELGDNDNNHFLCMDTDEPAVSVAFPAGHLVDPNLDLNPDTRIDIDRDRH